jgi:Na+-translocating ferredoxin:NAD+ oxidoreductase RnfD subunit
MNKFFKTISRALPDKSDFFLLLGVSCIFWGIYQIHIPVAFIVTGILFALIGYINAGSSFKDSI